MEPVSALAVEETVAPWQPHHRRLGATPDGVDADLDSAPPDPPDVP